MINITIKRHPLATPPDLNQYPINICGYTTVTGLTTNGNLLKSSIKIGDNVHELIRDGKKTDECDRYLKFIRNLLPEDESLSYLKTIKYDEVARTCYVEIF